MQEFFLSHLKEIRVECKVGVQKEIVVTRKWFDEKI